MYIYMYMCVYVYVHIYMYIYNYVYIICILFFLQPLQLRFGPLRRGRRRRLLTASQLLDAMLQSGQLPPSLEEDLTAARGGALAA